MSEKRYLDYAGLQSYHSKIMQEIANAAGGSDSTSSAAINAHNSNENAHSAKFSNYLEKSKVGASGGVAPLDDNGKIPASLIPDTLLGQVTYLGVWDVVAGAAVSDAREPVDRAYRNGDYYIATTQSSTTANVGSRVPMADGTGGASNSGYSFTDGDWLIFNGGSWDKIDNSDAVISVAGKTGAVVLSASDVGLGNVQNKPMDTSPKSGSANYITSGAVYTAVNGKQDKLTFDATPTSNSSNPVTAKGIYSWGVGAFLPTAATVNGKAFVDDGKGARKCTLTAADVGAISTSDLVPITETQINSLF